MGQGLHADCFGVGSPEHQPDGGFDRFLLTWTIPERVVVAVSDFSEAVALSLRSQATSGAVVHALCLEIL
jgi:hypothetical protein